MTGTHITLTCIHDISKTHTVQAAQITTVCRAHEDRRLFVITFRRLVLSGFISVRAQFCRDKQRRPLSLYVFSFFDDVFVSKVRNSWFQLVLICYQLFAAQLSLVRNAKQFAGDILPTTMSIPSEMLRR
jgi:hypothetical protein